MSEALASAWPSGDERADPMYWYWRWNGDWGETYNHPFTPEEAERLNEFRAAIERHPWVSRLEPDD